MKRGSNEKQGATKYHKQSLSTASSRYSVFLNTETESYKRFLSTKTDLSRSLPLHHTTVPSQPLPIRWDDKLQWQHLTRVCSSNEKALAMFRKRKLLYKSLTSVFIFLLFSVHSA